MTETSNAIVVDKDELREIVSEAVRFALRDVGITASDDQGVERWRANMAFLDGWRRNSESAKAKLGLAALASAYGGLIVIITLGAKTWLQTPTP